MTPEQEELLDLIGKLPVHDGRLPVQDIENGRYREIEQSIQFAAKKLAGEGMLKDFLGTKISDHDGDAMTVDFFLKNIKRYQITDDGTLISKSRARRSEIAGVPGHADQREAFLAVCDFETQNIAVSTFLGKLKHSRPEFFKEGARIFDIGFFDGSVSQALVNGLIVDGMRPEAIAYRGMDLQPSHIEEATTALTQTGIPLANIHLQGGKLGFSDKLLHDGSPNHALTLQETLESDKPNIVLAHNVYNFGDPNLFWAQAQGALDKESIVIALHDEGGDLADFRNHINSRADTPLLRNAPSASDAVQKQLATQGMTFSDFSVPYTITFPDMPQQAWRIMAEHTQTGVFNRPYEQDVAGTGIDPQQYKQFRLLVEYVIGEPLATFSPDERTRLLDSLHEFVQSKGNKFSGSAGVQVALSREHSKELAEAVEQAARAAGRELAPNLEAARTNGEGRRLSR